MLNVIKRSGRKEPFSIEKIAQSLGAASDELDKPINSSDLKYIAERTYKILDGRDAVNSDDVYVCLIGVLCTEGYNYLADAYVKNHNI